MTRTTGNTRSDWIAVIQSAALFACCVGVGRFVYTPILPLMIQQAGLSREQSALVATANFVGYLAGALTGFAVPAVLRSRTANRVCLALLVATLALVPVTTNVAAWMLVRLAAGALTAIIFMFTVSSTLATFRDSPRSLAGWAFGGVGAGIAFSGIIILVLSPLSDWRIEWWASALFAVLLSCLGWNLQPANNPVPLSGERTRVAVTSLFVVLLISYSLEGLGYIVAGSFLVTAVSQSLPLWLAGGVWVLVGVAALPSAALWSRLAARFSLSTMLVATLFAQAVGLALFPLVGGVVTALICAISFGGTFVAISTIALGLGAELNFPRSVAILTAGYSLGQIIGPLAVTPFLSRGYSAALVAGAITVAVAAVAAAVLHMRLRRRRSGRQVNSAQN